MVIITTIKAEAGAPDRRMTLDELRQFVAECDRNEAPGDCWLEVTTKGVGKLRTIELVRR